MKKFSDLIRITTLAAVIFCCTAANSESALIKAKISDINDKPVEGVKLFLYESSNVRKPADFISVPSDINGRTVVTVPDGKYWAVARLKKDALYGPLMPGDKHSGEPVEVDCSGVSETAAEFVVADIREIGQKKRTNNPETVRVWGKILDKQGKPVARAYVFANSSRNIEYIPEYLSTWTDESGSYSLYLPSKGTFFVGSSQQFPPPSKPSILKEFVPVAGKLDIATDTTSIVY